MEDYLILGQLLSRSFTIMRQTCFGIESVKRMDDSTRGTVRRDGTVPETLFHECVRSQVK